MLALSSPLPLADQKSALLDLLRIRPADQMQQRIEFRD